MNPTEGGTLPRNMATLQSLRHWRDIHAELLQNSMGTLSALSGAAAGQQQGNSSALGFSNYNTIESQEKQRKIDDGV